MAVTSIAPVADATLDAAELARMDAYWRAANYLSVGQIYLLDNPLLREPLALEHVKPRLLGPLGHDPGAELHLRPPQPRDHGSATSTSSTSPGPGHGGPGSSPTRTSRAPTARSTRTSSDEEGLRRLFKQFSFPGGIPSHVAPETPGSIHEGGELGYSLVARVRRGVRQPGPRRRLRRSATARRRPARWPRAGTRTSSSTRRATAPCCRSCTSTATRSPTRRCSRGSSRRSSSACSSATAGRRTSSRASDPAVIHREMAATLDDGARRDRADPGRGARERRTAQPPALADDRAAHAEGLDRAEGGRRPARPRAHSRSHQVPLSALASNPEHLAAARGVDAQLPARGAVRRRRPARARARARSRPEGERRMGANPHANGGTLLREPAAARLPRLRGRRPGARRVDRARPRGCSAASCATSCGATARAQLPRLRARRDRVQPAGGGLRGHRPGVDGRAPPTDEHLAPDGRVMEVLSSTPARAGSRATC